MNIRSLSRGDGAVIGAAVLLLIASFLPFFTYKSYSGSGEGVVEKSVSSWNSALFPVLPSVTLAALIAAGLIVAARTQPAGRQVLGLALDQWGVALAVFAGWSALWSALSNLSPESSDGVSKGVGAWLTLVFGIALAVVAVLSTRLPALKAPLAGAPKPPQQPYPGQPYPGAPQPGLAQPGLAQPGMPQPGGYGYPGAPAPDPSFGGQPQPHAFGGQPPAPAAPQAQQPQPGSPDFTAFWFAVPVPRPLFPEDGSPTPIAELAPGTWYLAVEQRGPALVAQTQDGRRGVLQDTSGIQRG
ncbi:DUF5336 domain-containing protein [Streptomyces sp. H10-C2]|uniref:DUF5336 domain-containing protein n=1 Tax=unclassified Streptomyces TaxID=2593676 RepID=UPI0024BADEDA|nr:MULTISPECIES: DUF5336 domain-containing protein [unclassified Streptomyces]MDJ0347011.1 DUF5336 domain-containing protein [Streptomyces sp. PH10-H1]MDJ0372435.1 DUF5336 domain-containing protein [Streptomyces sp. H10-C2]